jgi:hypothetical protein
MRVDCCGSGWEMNKAAPTYTKKSRRVKIVTVIKMKRKSGVTTARCSLVALDLLAMLPTARSAIVVRFIGGIFRVGRLGAITELEFVSIYDVNDRRRFTARAPEYSLHNGAQPLREP